MNIYLLADGFTEDYKLQKTILNDNHFKNLNKLARIGELGLYEPVNFAFASNLATYIIYPYFFNLPPNNNPGRAGLELIENNIEINNFPCQCVIRIVPRNYDIRQGWRIDKFSKNKEKEVIRILNTIANELNVVIAKSKISSELWSIASTNIEQLENFINIIIFELSKIKLIPYTADYKNYQKKEICKSNNTYILGWAVGTLLTALKYTGIKDYQDSNMNIKKELFNYSKKLSNLSSYIIPILKSNLNTDNSFIIYVKEPSRAARQSINQDKKKDAILFVDNIVEKLLSEFNNKDVNILFLSDHQSNLGIEKTFKGATMYCLANLKKKQSNKIFFTEKEALISNGIISQKILLTKIQDFIKK